MTAAVTPEIPIRSDVAALAGQLSGPTFMPDDPGYAEEIAPFNLAVTHTPRLVVAPAAASDVAAAVGFAVRHRIPVGVQATGHGAVTPVDGMLISTRRMQQLSVDPARRTATIGAGVRWASVIGAASDHGLTPLTGSQSGVGAIGYTLGGGLPVLGRTFGFAADLVRSLELVAADGAIRTVDAEHFPDLFWGLRGGKGNLGIVTCMTIDLVPVARLYGGCIFYAGEAMPEVLDTYRTWSAALPECTNSSLAILRLPPAPELPEPLRGRFVVQLRIAHVGDAAEGCALLAPMRAVGAAILDTVGEMPVTAIDNIHQDPHRPMPTYGRCALLRDLTAQGVDTLLAHVGPDVDTPVLMVELRQLGGALARQPLVPNAVTGRDAGFALVAIGVLAPPFASQVPSALDALVAAFAPDATGATFVNLHGAPGDATDRARAWTPATYQRLRELKATYDPSLTFRFGHAIGV